MRERFSDGGCDLGINRSIFRHPLFVGLKRKIGARALECLGQLWGHVAATQRCAGMSLVSLGKVSADYVEMAAGWRGKRGRLFDALVRPIGDADEGWVRIAEDGEVFVFIFGQFVASDGRF